MLVLLTPAKFTVVTLFGFGVWHKDEVQRLANRLRACVYTYPRRLSVAIIAGEHSKASIVDVLGTDDFGVELKVKC